MAVPGAGRDQLYTCLPRYHMSTDREEKAMLSPVFSPSTSDVRQIISHEGEGSETENNDDNCCVCQHFSPPGLSEILKTQIKFIN